MKRNNEEAGRKRKHNTIMSHPRKRSSSQHEHVQSLVRQGTTGVTPTSTSTTIQQVSRVSSRGPPIVTQEHQQQHQVQSLDQQQTTITTFAPTRAFLAPSTSYVVSNISQQPSKTLTTMKDSNILPSTTMMSNDKEEFVPSPATSKILAALACSSLSSPSPSVFESSPSLADEYLRLIEESPIDLSLTTPKERRPLVRELFVHNFPARSPLGKRDKVANRRK